MVRVHRSLHPAIQARLTGLFGMISSLNYNFEKHSGLVFALIDNVWDKGQIGSDKSFISILSLRQG